MTDDTCDTELESHIKEFLQAIGERPDQLIEKHIAGIQNPNPQDMEGFRRYVNDLKRTYGEGLQDMYRRIASHGLAICELTDETEITEPVEKIMTLAAVEGEDVPKLLAGFEEAASAAESCLYYEASPDDFSSLCSRGADSGSARRADP